ncbi:MAG: ABC transporter permease, partial [Gemmatimonadaceae bacterium]
MKKLKLEEALLPPVVALLIAVLVGDLLILSFGQSPAAVYRLLISGTWGNAYGFGQVLYKATMLTFTGLSVALALRAGMFNIGAEGQLAAGGFAAALFGLALPANVPAMLVLPAYVVVAGAAGGLVGGIPGVLKARFGAHEVITTIMINFIVLALLNYLISAHFNVLDTLHTAEIRSGALPRLSDFASAFHGSAANTVLLVALALAAAAWVFLFRTRAGFDLRAVGLQSRAAEYSGVNVGGVWW